MTSHTDTQEPSAGGRDVSRSVGIDAPVSVVWDYLTTPALMKAWMFDEDIDILTDWRVGSPFLIRGHLHGIAFENGGLVLEFERGQRLRYSHLSSLSRLPDRPESYSVVEFKLTPDGRQTTVKLALSNFPTEAIYKHLVFYWDVALAMLKQSAERSG